MTARMIVQNPENFRVASIGDCDEEGAFQIGVSLIVSSEKFEGHTVEVGFMFLDSYLNADQLYQIEQHFDEVAKILKEASNGPTGSP